MSTKTSESWTLLSDGPRGWKVGGLYTERKVLANPYSDCETNFHGKKRGLIVLIR